MSRSTILLILGILVLIAPFMGLPLSWLSWLLPILGVLIGIIGLTLRKPHAPQSVSPQEA